MAIPARQIGWSQKSNLLWQISKQLEYLTGVLYKGTTTTTTTTASPTTTTTTTSGGGPTTTTTTTTPIPFSGTVDIIASPYCLNSPSYSSNVSGDSSFCNSTQFTGGTFMTIPAGTWAIRDQITLSLLNITTNGSSVAIVDTGIVCYECTTTTTTTIAIPTVTIGTQIWTDANLEVTTYRNGDVIPEVTDQSAWAGLTTGAWCWYNNNSANNAGYGKLYNWYAVNDPRGLAPNGFHVPSWDEWNTLVATAGGVYFAQFSLVETGTTCWVPPNTGATNSTGFSACAGGFRDNSNFNQGPFIPGVTNNEANFWTSTSYDLTTKRGIKIQEGSNVYVDGGGSPTYGFSVRLVKD